MVPAEQEQATAPRRRESLPPAVRVWLWAAGALFALALALGGRALASHACLNAGMLAVVRSASDETPRARTMAATERRLQRALAWGDGATNDAHIGLAVVSEWRGDSVGAADHWQAAGYGAAEMAAAARELYGARQYAVAAGWYERAIAAQPGEAAYWDGLVRCNSRLERWPQALDIAERATEQVAPTAAGYSDLLAWVGSIRAQHVAQPDLPAALTALDAALAADRFGSERSRIEALAVRADALRQTDRGAEAIADYERVLAFDPERYWALCNLGSLYWTERGDAESAEAAYQHAQALLPRNKEAYFRLAALYRQTGRPDQAMAIYQRILDLDQKDARARNALVRLRGAQQTP